MGWTNFAPEVVLQMKNDGIIITTNGLDAAIPVIVAKYDKGRVFGVLKKITPALRSVAWWAKC